MSKILGNIAGGKEPAINKHVRRKDIREVHKQKSQGIVYSSGVGNTHKDENLPKYEFSTSERIIQGTSNALIVIGNDRNKGETSGNGGFGQTGAASIDIIVGLQGYMPPSPSTTFSKDFSLDSGRMYISQMCDLDNYFEIPKLSAKIGTSEIVPIDNTKDTSGIGLKADHVRIIARENIKLVTNHSGFNGRIDPVTKDGIYLIAGYDLFKFPELSSDLQLEPMVKGGKLIKFLEVMIEKIQNVQANLSNFIKDQSNINRQMLNHRHQTLKNGNLTEVMTGRDVVSSILEVDRITKPDGLYNTIENELTKQYLSAGSPDYINSKWHKLN